jgi:hypothetical protein
MHVAGKQLPKLPHDILHFRKVVFRHDAEQVLTVVSVHNHEGLRVLVPHTRRELTCAS